MYKLVNKKHPFREIHVRTYLDAVRVRDFQRREDAFLEYNIVEIKEGL